LDIRSGLFSSHTEEVRSVAGWLLLTAAILTEVAATIALKMSDGFTRLGPSVVVVVGYLVSFTLLAKLLTSGMPLAVVYAVWSAVGVALIALIGALWLGEHLTWVQSAGLLLVVAGVWALEAGGSHA
jgi:small multidrug resistance pump